MQLRCSKITPARLRGTANCTHSCAGTTDDVCYDATHLELFARQWMVGFHASRVHQAYPAVLLPSQSDAATFALEGCAAVLASDLHPLAFSDADAASGADGRCGRVMDGCDPI